MTLRDNGLPLCCGTVMPGPMLSVTLRTHCVIIHSMLIQPLRTFCELIKIFFKCCSSGAWLDAKLVAAANPTPVVIEVLHVGRCFGNGGVAPSFGWSLATQNVWLERWLLFVKSHRWQRRRLMDVIMIHHLSKFVIGHRAKVAIAFIHDRRCAVEILKTIDAKAIIGITKKRPMITNSFNMITSGRLMIVILGSRANGWCDVPTTKQRYHGSIHIVAFGLRGTFEMHTIQMNPNLLILHCTMIQMIWKTISCWIWKYGKLIVDLNGHWDVPIKSQFLC